MKVILANNMPVSIISALENKGFEVFKTPFNPNVMQGLSYHPDMQIAGIGSTYVCEPSLYNYYQNIFADSSSSLLCGNSKCSCNYPEDVAYNIKVIGNRVVHNFRYTDNCLRNLIGDMDLINVSQGYSGCSICAVSPNALITADRIISLRAKEHVIHTLLVSPGSIELEGFDYGFIGGASFLHEHTVYFFGNVKNHPDYSNIKKFCLQQNVDICCLSEEPLTDYGSAITFD